MFFTVGACLASVGFGYFLGWIFRSGHPKRIELFDNSKRGEVVRAFELTDEGRKQVAVFPAYSGDGVRDLALNLGAEVVVVHPAAEKRGRSV